jgi:thiamine biosynthesis protein ThiS
MRGVEKRDDGMTSNDTIEVQINGEDRLIPRGLSVHGLLERFELNPALVVVELNREILDRSRYSEIEVEEEDTLELVHFVGGG